MAKGRKQKAKPAPKTSDLSGIVDLVQSGGIHDQEATPIELTDPNQLENTLSTREAVLKQREQNLDIRDTEIKQREQNLDIRDAEIKQREQNLDIRDAEIKQREQNLDIRDAEIKQREQNLDIRDTEIKQREQNLDIRDTEIKQREQNLDIRDTEIKQREQNLDIRDTEIKQREQNLDIRDTEIKQREINVINRESELLAREKQINVIRTENTELTPTAIRTPIGQKPQFWVRNWLRIGIWGIIYGLIIGFGVYWFLPKKQGITLWTEDSTDVQPVSPEQQNPALANPQPFRRSDSASLVVDSALLTKPVLFERLKFKLKQGISSEITQYKDQLFFGGFDNKVYATDTNGQIAWFFSTPGLVQTAPVVSGKSIYVGFSNKGGIFCHSLSKGRKEKWRVNTDAPLTHPLQLSNSGILLAIHTNQLTALDTATGKVAWVYGLAGGLISSAFTHEKLVVFATQQSLTALNIETGKVIWETAIQNDRQKPGHPAGFADQDRVYHIDGRGRLMAYQLSTGKPVWKQPITIGSPGQITASKNEVYIATEKLGLFAFSTQSGKLKWRQQFKGQTYTRPIIGKSWLYTTVRDYPNDLFIALHPETGKVVSKIKLEDAVRKTPLFFDSKFYFSDEKGRFYIVATKDA